jgi:hypothetical protein
MHCHQQLSQATGMDIEQLMSLQQGGEGDTKGTLDKKNAEKTGKDIANGALKQDIANEAAKLGAEQAFRRKMMEFEQKERKGMLFIEQMQRLEGIAMEQKWRVKLAAAEKQGTLDLEIGRMQAESASKLVSSVFNSASQEYKSKLDADKSLSDSQRASMLQSYETSKAGSEEYIQKLVQSGVLTSESASQTMTTLGQKFANGEMLNQQQIADLLTKEGAFQAAQDKAKAAQEEMDKKKAEAAAKVEETSLNWGESLLATIGSSLSWTGDEDLFGYGAKQLNEQAAANTALQNLNAEQDILTQQNKGMADVQGMIKDNDNLRGIAHSQKFDYQAKVQNESVKATYAVVASIEALALAQGKAITLDTSGVASSINRLQGVNYTIAQ